MRWQKFPKYERYAVSVEFMEVVYDRWINQTVKTIYYMPAHAYAGPCDTQTANDWSRSGEYMELEPNADCDI